MKNFERNFLKTFEKKTSWRGTRDLKMGVKGLNHYLCQSTVASREIVLEEFAKEYKKQHNRFFRNFFFNFDKFFQSATTGI